MSGVVLTAQNPGLPKPSGEGGSKWVYVGADQRHYGTDARGNRIMDFSHAGYNGGGVPLPTVRAFPQR